MDVNNVKEITWKVNLNRYVQLIVRFEIPCILYIFRDFVGILVE